VGEIFPPPSLYKFTSPRECLSPRFAPSCFTWPFPPARGRAPLPLSRMSCVWVSLKLGGLCHFSSFFTDEVPASDAVPFLRPIAFTPPGGGGFFVLVPFAPPKCLRVALSLLFLRPKLSATRPPFDKTGVLFPSPDLNPRILLFLLFGARASSCPHPLPFSFLGDLFLPSWQILLRLVDSLFFDTRESPRTKLKLLFPPLTCAGLLQWSGKLTFSAGHE